MKYLIYCYLSLLLVLTIQCSKDEFPTGDNKYDFAIYLLRDQELKIDDILTKGLADQDSIELSKIEIQNHPWLTDEDIDFYDFSSHLIYLKKEKSYFLPERVELAYPLSWWDKPFVVIANGQKRYVGIFASSLSIDKWPVPEINDLFNYLLYPNDLMYIQWSWFPKVGLNDSRPDQFVKQALIKTNKLHEGIKVTLNKILFTENSDTATVEYTYTIKNNDTFNLFVLDPDKMGIKVFSRYCNGPSILKSDETSTRESIYKKVDLTQPDWNPDWFVRINSGDSITRVVNLKGYSQFPPGIYYCELIFNSIRKIPKDQRVLSDGRYWIGQTISNLIAIQY